MAFVAGLIDSAVGGGGLIQIPALFNALPSEAPATLFGTNKFASIFGTATAARSYMRRITLSWSLVLPATVCAFALSFAGAAVVSHVPKTVMKPAVLVMLIAMAGYTLCFFVPSGNILIEYAVPMAVCNIAGSLVGTHLAMKGGSAICQGVVPDAALRADRQVRVRLDLVVPAIPFVSRHDSSLRQSPILKAQG